MKKHRRKKGVKNIGNHGLQSGVQANRNKRQEPLDPRVGRRTNSQSPRVIQKDREQKKILKIWPLLREYGKQTLIGIAVTISIFVWGYCKNEYFSVLTISPHEIDVNCTERSAHLKEFSYPYLTNNSSVSIYGIQLDATYPKDVSVELFPEKTEMINLGPYNMKSTFSIGEIVDNGKNGYKVTTSKINNLGPKETTKVKVEVDESGCKNNFVIKLNPTFRSKAIDPILSYTST